MVQLPDTQQLLQSVLQRKIMVSCAQLRSGVLHRPETTYRGCPLVYEGVHLVLELVEDLLCLRLPTLEVCEAGEHEILLTEDAVDLDRNVLTQYLDQLVESFGVVAVLRS